MSKTRSAAVEVIAALIELDSRLEGAALVITGEGRFDAQTLRGKTPLGVARAAQKHGVPVIVLAGTLERAMPSCMSMGLLPPSPSRQGR